MMSYFCCGDDQGVMNLMSVNLLPALQVWAKADWKMWGLGRCSDNAGGEERLKGTGIHQEYINVEDLLNVACTVQPGPQRVNISESISSQEQGGMWKAERQMSWR